MQSKLKYRIQSEPIKVSANNENQNLILESLNDFLTFIQADKRINLNLELIEKKEDEMTFFYFSNLNISFQEFRETLNDIQSEFWSILFLKYDNNPKLQNDNHEINYPKKLFSSINQIMSLSNLFFKIGIRINTGDWKQTETEALLKCFFVNEWSSTKKMIIDSTNIKLPFTSENLHYLIKRNFDIDKVFTIAKDLFILKINNSNINEKDSIKKRIEDNLINNRFDSVFLALKEYYGKNDKQCYNQVVLISASLSRVQTDFSINLIDYQQKSIELAKIRYALLNLINNIDIEN